jgi:hypothetical protein
MRDQAELDLVLLARARRQRTDGDVLLGNRAIGVLAASSSSGGTPLLRIPTGTAAGRYFFFAVSDDTKVVPETIESNNIRGTSITVP